MIKKISIVDVTIPYSDMNQIHIHGDGESVIFDKEEIQDDDMAILDSYELTWEEIWEKVKQ